MKILYIDDNRILIDRVKSILDPIYTVDFACTGYEGVESARIINYSLILLDLGLPDTNGYEVCKELRSLGVKTPVLVLTVQKDIETSVKLLNCGADDFLTKPFNSEVLKARVAALLRRSQDMHEEYVVTV